jgi:hypothetical protein
MKWVITPTAAADEFDMEVFIDDGMGYAWSGSVGTALLYWTGAEPAPPEVYAYFGWGGFYTPMANTYVDADYAYVSYTGGGLNADVDGDGDVDIFDFNQYAAWYNILDLNADVDGDSDVDIFDFNQYAAWYNEESGGDMGPAGVVPEPTTLLLVAGGVAGLVLRRRSA